MYLMPVTPDIFLQIKAKCVLAILLSG